MFILLLLYDAFYMYSICQDDSFKFAFSFLSKNKQTLCEIKRNVSHVICVMSFIAGKHKHKLNRFPILHFWFSERKLFVTDTMLFINYEYIQPDLLKVYVC